MHARAGGEREVRLLELAEHALVREHVSSEGALVVREDARERVLARAVRAVARTVPHSFSLTRPRRGWWRSTANVSRETPGPQWPPPGHDRRGTTLVGRSAAAPSREAARTTNNPRRLKPERVGASSTSAARRADAIAPPPRQPPSSAERPLRKQHDAALGHERVAPSRQPRDGRDRPRRHRGVPHEPSSVLGARPHHPDVRQTQPARRISSSHATRRSIGSTSMTSRSGSMAAITRPGSPAPEPTSIDGARGQERNDRRGVEEVALPQPRRLPRAYQAPLSPSAAKERRGSGDGVEAALRSTSATRGSPERGRRRGSRRRPAAPACRHGRCFT